MNDKLNEIRDYHTQLQDSAKEQSAFKEGFNMAIDLNLAKQHIEWIFSEKGTQYVEAIGDNYKEIDKDEEAITKLMTDTYDYWIKNIFKPKS